jgi:hypothetical protein
LPPRTLTFEDSGATYVDSVFGTRSETSSLPILWESGSSRCIR